MNGHIAKLGQQLDEFRVAAMNIADNVERAGFGFLVVVEGNTLDGDGFRFLRRGKNQDVAKAFAF